MAPDRSLLLEPAIVASGRRVPRMRTLAMPAAEPALRPITVSVVTHGQWALVEPLLQQLDAHCRSVIERIVLTVNLPESVALDPAWRIPVHVIRNPHPAGFGANHNAAFRTCETPWFLVLNPDIRLHADALSPLLRLARSQAGLLAPRIQEPWKASLEPYRDLPTPGELVRRRLPGHQPPASPAWVPGMFMLLRAEAFAAVGGFNERYFMYCEDVELCARLRLAGWNLQLEQTVQVLHEAQRASQASLRPLLWHLASLAKLWTSGPFWRYRRLLSA